MKEIVTFIIELLLAPLFVSLVTVYFSYWLNKKK